MKRIATFLLGLVLLGSGFLFGKQDSENRGGRASAPSETSPQVPLAPDRPAGVEESAWVPLDTGCGVIVRPRADRNDASFMGQLTCRIEGEWHAVFLADRPPSITPSE
jgi:hypothetical protein